MHWLAVKCLSDDLSSRLDDVTTCWSPGTLKALDHFGAEYALPF
jgi:hypothetical protein